MANDQAPRGTARPQRRSAEWSRPDLAGEGEIDVNAISAKAEIRGETRNPAGTWVPIIRVVGIASSLFHFYTAGYRPLPALEQRPIHLAVMLFLCFLLYPATSCGKDRQPSALDVVLAVVGAATSVYLAVIYEDFVLRGGMPTQTDIIVGTLFCIIVAEAARRTMGMFLLVLAAIFIGYLFVGPWLPDILAHGGFGFRRVIRHMYMSTEGVYGIALGVSATYVYLFILFGAFLQQSGTTSFFTNIAFAAAGHSPGGPAKVGVIASALMGTIQGSSAANVASTGVFTIPLMMRLGFRGYYAAAVEAVASCGGQFLPPVMGASAFIMAEYLQMPYAQVAAGAMLPAILYYAAVYLQVHLRAVKVGMEGLPRNRLPKVKRVLLRQGHLVIPIFVLIGMLIMGFTALFAAFFSILTVIAVSAFRRETRMNLGKILAALEAGARNTVSTAIACAGVGFIVGSVGLSGIGLLFTQSIIGLAQGELLPAILLAAGCSLFLSFGLPTTSVYIITATLVAPSLAQLGVPPLVAHLFCYYWGGVSAITPPVALAAYVGAGIAGAPVMKTGFTAMRLGMAAYLVPFIYVYWPALVMWHEAPLHRVVLALIGGAVGVFCMGAIGERYITRELPWTQMALLAIAIVAVMHPAAIANVLAVAIALGVGAWEWRARPSPVKAS
ncbi:TRAP transporter permease [Elioraea tepidiphila]|uniref:TRAP transporter permease n=1 Tax=Elioraea tepidiphila TaxID=457934 RepID=UPI000376AB5F|nr:TRAP transporter permease [Elioraea tepidiphila]